MKSIAQHVPESLIYEIVDGQPIYYKGYKDFLNGEKQPGDIRASTYIQSLVITALVCLLDAQLNKKYQVLTSEVGLQFKEKRRRAADIAIFEKAKLRQVKDKNKYLKIAPRIVIEIDVKAEIEEVKDAFGYFHKKTDELLNNGVEKVIWIFTDSQKVMIVEAASTWQVLDWSKDIEIMGGLVINIEKLIELEEE